MFFNVLFDQGIKAGFIDRDLAASQAFDLGIILVHTDDVVAELREAGAADQADIARTNNCNLHKNLKGEKGDGERVK